MAPLESFNNLPETPVQKPTGVSETSKDYQNPLNNIKEINQREKIDKSISEVWLQKEETEAIVDTIISKFWNDEKAIDSILQTISSDISIDTKDKVLWVIVKAEEAKIDAEKTKIDAEKTKIDAEKTKIDAEKTKIDAEKTKAEIESEKSKEILFKNLTDILSWAKLEWKNGQDIVKKLGEWKFNEVIETLKTNPLVFNEVATELKAKSPEKYREFINTLIQIDPSFREIADQIEVDKLWNVAKLKLWTDNLNWVDLSKNVLRQEKDGAVIEAGKNSRNLSLVGSDYKLDSKLQNSNQKNAIKEVETNLKNDLKPINETLNTISSVIDYLDKALSNNLELKDIKENIKNTNISLYTELNIENLNSVSDIKNAFVWLQTQKQKEKEDKIKEAKQKISLFIKQNADIAKEQDEKKKDILKFLTSIGFDKIPQSITSQLIKELQSNVFTLWELNLNLKTIDLNNGRFGETDTESGGTKWKENLVKFMEKMIYWQVWAKESLFAWKWFSSVLWATVNPTEMNVTFEKAWIKTGTGWDINKMRQNLSKVKE